MHIPTVVASTDVSLSFMHVKAPKSTVPTESCLLTYPNLSLYGRYFDIDLRTADNP